eukprot:4082029-Amphidinium_carterae.1
MSSVTAFCISDKGFAGVTLLGGHSTLSESTGTLAKICRIVMSILAIGRTSGFLGKPVDAEGQASER